MLKILSSMEQLSEAVEAAMAILDQLAQLVTLDRLVISEVEDLLVQTHILRLLRQTGQVVQQLAQ